MDIIILGGGSSGWMSATYFKKVHPTWNVTVIDSDTVPSKVVGESTTPSFGTFMALLGYADESWMKECSATYKVGVLYDGWGKGPWFNRFDVRPSPRIVDPYKDLICTESSKCFVKPMSEENQHYGLDKTLYPDGPVYMESSCLPYGYHLDAVAFGVFLKKIGAELGVISITDHIDTVNYNEDGITNLVSSSGIYSADHYIDASGFSRVLMSKVSTEPVLKPDAIPPLDKAMVLRKTYINKSEQLKARTKATTLSAGWCWEIPLYKDIGCGYVYSSEFITDEEAEAELREALGDTNNDFEPFIVPFDCGYYKDVSVLNVTAVGLSAGFIEPLEATSLFMTQLIIELLDNVLDGTCGQQEFNNNIDRTFGAFTDFITSNYRYSERTEPFWVRDMPRTEVTTTWEETGVLSTFYVYGEGTYIQREYDLNHVFIKSDADEPDLPTQLEILNSGPYHIRR